MTNLIDEEIRRRKDKPTISQRVKNFYGDLMAKRKEEKDIYKKNYADSRKKALAQKGRKKGKESVFKKKKSFGKVKIQKQPITFRDTNKSSEEWGSDFFK